MAWMNSFRNTSVLCSWVVSIFSNFFSAVHGLDEQFQEYKYPVFMGCIDLTVIFFSAVHCLDEQFQNIQVSRVHGLFRLYHNLFQCSSWPG